MHFWVSKNGNTTGPYAESQILSMWHNGTLTVDALCWSEGYTSWASITSVIEQLMKPQSALPESSDHDPAPTEYEGASDLKAAPKSSSRQILEPTRVNALRKTPPRVTTQTSKSVLNPERDGISGLGCLFSGLVVMLIGLSFMHGNPVSSHLGLAVGITVLAWMRLVRVGKSPWLAVLGLVPFINFIFAIACLVYRDDRPISKTHMIVSWCCFIALMVCLNLIMGGAAGPELNLGFAAVFLPYLISITLHWRNTTT